MALYVATKVSVVEPQLYLPRLFMTLRAFEARLTVAGMRAKSEVGVQGDTQDFRGSFQWGHLVSETHLWVLPRLVDIRGN